jgi:hypothetical protein
MIVIRAIRTGGFAGARREWQVQGEAGAWMPLIEACSWRDIPPALGTADGFEWRIEVRGRVRRTARVPDAALEGPLRDLVERVQALSSPGSSGR